MVHRSCARHAEILARIEACWDNVARGVEKLPPFAERHLNSLELRLEQEDCRAIDHFCTPSPSTNPSIHLPQPTADGSRAGEGPDGPLDPNLLCWAGQQHELPPRLWRLLKSVWEARSVTIEKVEETVRPRDVSEKTVRSAVSKLNTQLQTIGIPVSLHIKGGFLTLDR